MAKASAERYPNAFEGKVSVVPCDSLPTTPSTPQILLGWFSQSPPTMPVEWLVTHHFKLNPTPKPAPLSLKI